MRKPRDWNRRLVLPIACCCIAVVLLIWPAALFARAGGGEGFGGGGGGGGGGHGGHGLGGLIYLLFQLVFNYPAIGIPVIIVLVVLFILSQRNSGADSPSQMMAPRSQTQLSPQAEHAAAAVLRARDPQFDPNAFFGRVNVAFGKIQAAWCSQNLDSVRPFISDAVHERFSLQFAEQQAAGWHDAMENVLVHGINIAELQSDGLFDELSVRIDASAADYHVSISTGSRIGGLTAPERFAEIWTFLRRRGAVTQPARAGLIEGNCPNCGAPIEMNQSANCTHCKALLRSGQYDWVLSEITQEVEWIGPRHANLPGVSAMRARDADFNAVEVEDRASVIFWRKATADRLGKIDPLRKCATDAFCEQYKLSLQFGPTGWRSVSVECAVGSVRLLGVAASTGPEEGDRALVEIHWSAKIAVLSATHPPRMNDEKGLASSLFVLWRNASAKTDAGKGVSSAHCPQCGAPESNSASNACEFCGAVLNDGSRGWVLVDVALRNSAQGYQMLAELGR